MPTMIRLSRHGKKHKAFYHIVVADGRAPRDGRFIEKIGTYNPIANPAEIKLDFDRALDWIQKGAQPTDTARTILSLKGVMFKHHLLGGVKKGAFTETEAEARFEKWISEKEAKIAAKRSGIDEKVRTEQKARFEAEVKVNEDRAAELAKRKAAEIDAKVKAAQNAAAEKAGEEEAAVIEEVAEIIEAKVETLEETEVKEEPATEATVEPEAEAKEEDEAKKEAEVEEVPKVETKEEAEVKEEPEAETKEEAEEETKKEE